MQSSTGNHDFVKASLEQLKAQLDAGEAPTRQAIASAIGSDDAEEIEAERARLAAHVEEIHRLANGEPSHRDVHYVSRYDGVGVYQSVLSRVFARIPGLQGYGNLNPLWATTLIEQGVWRLKNFFHQVHEDINGEHQSLLASVLKEWKALKFARAPYPAGVPTTISFADNAKVALLADWGGDNPAAKHIASVVQKHKPDIAIHLGDIYYGGVESECRTFLQLWPLQTNSRHPELGVPPGSSLALNGNHEMYSGGQAYFDIVLTAFKQPQPFFCLENTHWRVIGLDTAYNDGRLKPSGPNNAMSAQWNWLIDLLKSDTGKATILLSHHQPVSAHADEFRDSAGLRGDIDELLATVGIDQDAIFGWFFGHEHRCALYDDNATGYNARLIGNGCVPHQAQDELAADEGCTPVAFFNRKETFKGSGAAVSMYAQLYFAGEELAIEYTDEDNWVWGTEVWNATKGRLNGGRFQETDGYDGEVRKVRGSR
jgi:hypothetical protein